MNFKHLYYFWVTAKAGGIMRAGEQLHTTPQTLSGQIKLLEEWLGRKLFRKNGRQLAAVFAKKFAPEPFFQQLDLAGQGLRRGVQLLARAHDAAGLGGHPEIIQVLEIHSFVSSFNHRRSRADTDRVFACLLYTS